MKRRTHVGAATLSSTPTAAAAAAAAAGPAADFHMLHVTLTHLLLQQRRILAAT